MSLFSRSLSFFLIAFLLGGCTGEKSDGQTITVWHWMSDREEAFQELARQYRDEFHIKVRFDLYAPSEAYAQRVKASAQTNTLPDVFGVLGEKRDFASFIQSGYIAELTEALNQPISAENPRLWKESFFEKALSVNEFPPDNEYRIKPGIYGVPIDVTTIQMVYNKEIYRRAGLDPESPPKTWKEFLWHAKTLKERGFPGLVGGFGEIWMLDAFSFSYAVNLMGEEKVFNTYRGQVPYTDPDWVRVLSLFKEMADEKVLAEGAVTMVNKSAEQTFANGRAAYAFNGSWCVNVYRGMNPNLDYAAMLPPAASNIHPLKIWGGAGSSFMVNDRSPRKVQAIHFLKWLTADKQQAALSEKTLNLPANKKSLGQIPAILAQFADDMDNVTHPNVYPAHEFPSVTEAFNKGIQSILIGEKTPLQIAQQVQRMKEKELRRSKPVVERLKS